MTTKQLQHKLSKVLNISLVIDGIYGYNTTEAVKHFQSQYGLVVDGKAGKKTQKALQSVYDTYSKVYPQENTIQVVEPTFAVFVDAGHGGINNEGVYENKGKRHHHKGAQLHDGGNFYEGFENRLAAEDFIAAATKQGVMCIRTYHPYKDWSLSKRAEIVISWLKRGYYGYLHSFHSNAVSLTNKRGNTRSKKELDQITGFCVFNTRGNNFSDVIATKHFDNVKSTIGEVNWRFRSQDSIDGDPDYEANFKILSETDLEDFLYFGAILDEWGFFTSLQDCKFIIDPVNRKRRTEACLKTAKWVKSELEKLVNNGR